MGQEITSLFLLLSLKAKLKKEAMSENSSEESTPNYWLVFGFGLAYILLLGLFTYFFNYPI